MIPLFTPVQRTFGLFTSNALGLLPIILNSKVLTYHHITTTPSLWARNNRDPKTIPGLPWILHSPPSPHSSQLHCLEKASLLHLSLPPNPLPTKTMAASSPPVRTVALDVRPFPRPPPKWTQRRWKKRSASSATRTPTMASTTIDRPRRHAAMERSRQREVCRQGKAVRNVRSLMSCSATARPSSIFCVRDSVLGGAGAESSRDMIRQSAQRPKREFGVQRFGWGR